MADFMKIQKLISSIKKPLAVKSVDKYNLKWLLLKIPIRNEQDEFIATSLKTDKGTFTDLRVFNRSLRIKIGKSELNLDTNGNVTSYKKPFYKSLNKLIDKSTELVKYISTNISNKEIVSKKTLSLLTFPKNTLKKLGI